jgi:hypothetical protein
MKNYIFAIKLLPFISSQCLETRTGLAGRSGPGTGPGLSKNPSEKLTRRNPVDPAGQLGTWSTWVNPPET